VGQERGVKQPLIMGHERYSNALASVGLQPSDVHAKDPRHVDKLWEALKRACDPAFIVRVEGES
jgi:hypothetical protein